MNASPGGDDVVIDHTANDHTATDHAANDHPATDHPAGEADGADRPLIFRLNPVAKLITVLPLSVALLLSIDWVSASVALGTAAVLLTAAGARGRVWRRTWPVWVGAPLTALTVLLYGRPAGATYLQFGVLQVSDGSITLSIATLLRVLALALPAVIMFVTLDPTELGDGLAQIVGLPSRFVLGAVAGLRMIGLFLDDWRALELARRARGVADHGRLRRLVGQALALLVLSIRRGSKLATTMEARGFGGPGVRTWARPSAIGRSGRVAIALGVLVAAVAVTAAILAGTWRSLG